MALAMATPAIYGSVIGWWQSGQFSPWLFIFLMTSVLATALGYQALATVYDYRRSLAPDAKPTDDTPDSPFTWVAAGYLPPAMLISPGWLLLTIAVVSGLWCTLLAGWPVLFFGGLAFLLLLASLLPPLRYAYRGWGIGELGVGASFGVLALLTGYYVQAQSLSWLPVLGGAPLIALVFLVVFNGNLGAWHRDWLMGKRTGPVMLGPARALDLSAAITSCGYVSILLVTVLSRLPIWNLAGLATLPLALGSFADVRRAEVTSEDGYCLRDAAVRAAIWTCVLICAALFISPAR
jgi:1,4-dihydroxy-2-naphthoate octaprenyltransferase